MHNKKAYTQEHKKESLRNALIDVGYDMAASQVEGMIKDENAWGEFIIDGKINPKCINISDQASHSFYNNELDIWFEPDEEIFHDEYGEMGINELIEKSGISEDEVFDLMYEGESKYINDKYGKDWKDKYPEPNYN